MTIADFTAQGMADIIAYRFARQYERAPGTPARGKAVFEQKRGAECHELEESDKPAAQRASAVGIAHSIWQHGAALADGMTEAGIPWPTFAGTDMADLIAYIRSVGELSGGELPESETKAGDAKSDE